MSLPILSESPIHFIDAIKDAVNRDKFEVSDALMSLYIKMMVLKMQNYDDKSVQKIAMSSYEATVKACSVYQKSSTEKQDTIAVETFTQENKVKILNDLVMIEKQLLKIYQDADVEVHRDN